MVEITIPKGRATSKTPRLRFLINVTLGRMLDRVPRVVVMMARKRPQLVRNREKSVGEVGRGGGSGC